MINECNMISSIKLLHSKHEEVVDNTSPLFNYKCYKYSFNKSIK
jgi:hypothetical protein